VSREELIGWYVFNPADVAQDLGHVGEQRRCRIGAVASLKLLRRRNWARWTLMVVSSCFAVTGIVSTVFVVADSSSLGRPPK
jgi:hypothetical protein